VGLVVPRNAQALPRILRAHMNTIKVTPIRPICDTSAHLTVPYLWAGSKAHTRQQDYSSTCSDESATVSLSVILLDKRPICSRTCFSISPATSG